MATLTNQQIAHEFFYSDFCSDNYPRSKNCGYRGDTFKSYATAVARVLTDKNGELVCLFSADTYSTTTAKQLSYLRRACPFTILYVPTEYGIGTIELSDVVYNLFEELDRCHQLDTGKKPNRLAIIDNYNQIQGILSHFNITLTEEQEEKLSVYRLFVDSVQVYEDVLAERRAKLAERRASQLAERTAKALEMLNSDNLLDVIETVYSSKSPLTYAQRAERRNQLDPEHNLSFVWVDGDTYRTSQGVTVSKREGDLLLKLFAAGKLRHGHHIDRYTVLSVCDAFVQIGCHKIPARNLSELAATL